MGNGRMCLISNNTLAFSVQVRSTNVSTSWLVDVDGGASGIIPLVPAPSPDLPALQLRSHNIGLVDVYLVLVHVSSMEVKVGG